MKKTLYLMRHGQTLFNVRRKIQGSCDSPLTALGIEQALKAREFIATINPDHAYCSSAERASDTLEIVTENKMPYQRLKGLKEMAFGTFEGESEDLNPSRDLFEDFFVPYGGESISAVQQRMDKTCREIMEKQDHQVVLAVSHAGASMNFLKGIMNEEELLNMGIFGNCNILKLEYENKSFKFIEVIRIN